MKDLASCFKSNAIIVIFVLTGWINPVQGQVTGYLLEWNGQQATFQTVSGLDGTTRTSVYTGRTLTTTRILNSGTIRTINVQKLRCASNSELYRWFCSFNQATREKRDIRIKLVNMNGETVKAWKIYQTSPSNMYDPPRLIADSNEVSIESVVLSYEKIEPDW